MDDNCTVVVLAICFKGDKILILKRSDKKTSPFLWECGGGRLKKGESFEETAIREISEETGYTIKIIQLLDSSFFLYDNQKIPALYFTGRITEDKEPVLTDEHTEYKFIGIDEIDNYDFAGDIYNEIKKAYEIIK